MSWQSGLQVRVIEGPDEGRVTALNFSKMMVGRARAEGSRVDGWVLLFDKSISRRHAEFSWDHRDQHYLLKHLSKTNFTWVNDVPLDDQIVIEIGSVIQMGGSRFRVEEFVESDCENLSPESIKEPDDGLVTERLQAVPRSVSLRGSGTPNFVVLQGVDRGFRESLRGLSITVGRSNLSAQELLQDERAEPFDQMVELSAPQVHPNHLLLRWDELKNGYSIFKNPSVPQPVVTRHSDGMVWEARLTDAGGFVRPSDRIFFAETLVHIEPSENSGADTKISPVPLTRLEP